MLIGFVLGRGRSWPYTVIVLGSARISYPQGIMSLPTACLRTDPRDQSEASREHGLPTNGHYQSLVEESKLFQKANLCVFTDSNVGKSIASRFGSSRKTKHVELRYLYVQELVASGMVRIRKVLGTLNQADILTKYIAKDTLHRHLHLTTHRGLDFATHHLFPRRTQTRKKRP